MNAPVLIIANDPAERERIRGGVEQGGRAAVAVDASGGYAAPRGSPIPAAAVVDVDDASDAIAAARRHCERLSAGARKGGVPILAVSRTQRLADIETLLRSGAADCLAKPVDPARLAWKLDRLLRPKHVDLPDAPEPLKKVFAETAKRHGVLAGGAGVHPGAMPRAAGFRRMAPPDSRWVGVLSGSGMSPFRTERPESFLYWHKRTLFRLPDFDEYAREKVVVRRLAPPVVAAVDATGTPVGGDALAVVPREDGMAGAAACILSSRVMDFYFNRLCPGAAGRSGRLRAGDLAGTPWGWPDAVGAKAFARIAKFLKHYGERPASSLDRQKRRELVAEMNDRVFDLYGFGAEEQKLLRSLYF